MLKLERKEGIVLVTESQLTMLKEKARIIRHDIIDMVGGKYAHVGHLGGSCSSADLVTALYFYKMRTFPQNPKSPNRDYFLLSKGHAALVQYAALAESGYFPKEELQNVKNLGAKLQGHPDMTKTPGVEANTGSLGQGLSLGLGIALGLKADQKSAKVYVLMGDGELAEGQIWEAAMAAANYKADNLVGILDRNRVQATGPVEERMDIGDVAAKWTAFGWKVIEFDGHDMKQICDALDQADSADNRPTLLLANTIKGKGVKFAEGNAQFHNAALNNEQFLLAHASVDEM